MTRAEFKAWWRSSTWGMRAFYGLTLWASAGALTQWVIDLRADPVEPTLDYIAIDGDTIEVQPGGERIRLYNVDTPERRCRCPDECHRAMLAKVMTQELLETHDVTIKRMKLDRYGRTVAAVFIDGADLGQWLIDSGIGRPYHGERRLPWCGQ